MVTNVAFKIWDFMYIRTLKSAPKSIITHSPSSTLPTNSINSTSHPLWTPNSIYTFKMYTSFAIVSALAVAVTAAPIASPQLLNDIAPPVAGLVTGLGLPTVGVPVGGVLEAASDNLKKRQLLNDIAPPVAGLVSGLGLPTVGVPVGGVLEAASDNL
jgi:hypothetical protein